MKPSKIEYEVGKTHHGQTLRLICVPGPNGGLYELRQEAANQRDETSVIRGLTEEAIRLIAQAARVIP